MEKRIDWIDFAKGFTIILVVIGHTLAYMTGNLFINHISYNTQMFIFSYVMPMFFAISGYLYKEVHNLSEYILLIYKKATAFVFPYILFNIILIIIRDNYSKYIIFNIYRFPLEYTWFLYALFFVFVVFGLMDYFHFGIFLKFIIIILMYLLTFELKQPNFPQYSGIFILFMFLPFFFLGYLVRKKYINIKELFSKRVYVVISIFLFIIMVFYCKLRFNVRATDANMSSINLVPRLLIVLIAFYLFSFIQKSGFVSKIGKNSMIIYLIHIPVILLILIKNTFFPKTITYIYVFFYCFVASLLISFVFIKLCRYSLVKWIFYPRKWMDPLVKKTKFGKWIFS